MLLLLLMAVTSTGSAEVIAVTSILVYDIYQLYLKVCYTKYHMTIVKKVKKLQSLEIFELGLTGVQHKLFSTCCVLSFPHITGIADEFTKINNFYQSHHAYARASL